MVVEFLRSCYVGQWRLFRDRPGTLTLGRYVRVPPGTPVYPGWHNFWSNTWVADRDNPPELPELGDVTGLNFRSIYTKGIGLFPAPPVVVGSTDCIATGEQFPPTGLSIMYDGVPSRCYDAAAMAYPFPQPRLWFKGDNILGVPFGAQIMSWGDYGTAVNTAMAVVPFFPPTYDGQKINGWPLLTFGTNRALFLQRALPLTNTFSLYAVFISGPGANPGMLSVGGGGGHPNSLPAFNLGLVQYHDSINRASAVFAPVAEQVYLLRLQKTPAWVEILMNGIPVLNAGTNQNGQSTIGALEVLQPLGAICQVAELIVFDQVLNIVQDAVVQQYLSEKFSLG